MKFVQSNGRSCPRAMKLFFQSAPEGEAALLRIIVPPLTSAPTSTITKPSFGSAAEAIGGSFVRSATRLYRSCISRQRSASSWTSRDVPIEMAVEQTNERRRYNSGCRGRSVETVPFSDDSMGKACQFLWFSAGRLERTRRASSRVGTRRDCA